MTAVYAGQLISSLLTSAVLTTPGSFPDRIVFGAVSIVGMVLVMLSIAASLEKTEQGCFRSQLANKGEQ